MSNIGQNERAVPPKKAKYRVRNAQGGFDIVYLETSADQVETDAQRQFVTEAERTQFNENTVYTNSKPTINAVGGMAPGSTFDKTPVKDVISQLLYPYISPEAKVTCMPPAGIYERGEAQRVTRITADITKKSEKITKVEFLDDAQVIGVREGDWLADGGIVDIDVDILVDSDKVFKARITDESGQTTTIDAEMFKFVSPYYMGVVADNAIIDEAQIESLVKRVADKGEQEYPYTCIFEKMVFSYPKEYGDITKIIDHNCFELTNAFDKLEADVTGLDGVKRTYTVYMSNHSCSVHKFNMKFYF